MAVEPSVVERLAAFQRATGLSPVGLHRSAADRLLRNVSHQCPQCSGQGFRPAGSSWLWCVVCGGLGRILTPRARLLLRRRVAERLSGSGGIGDAS
jgi:DnaJ-class molecular chaperone